LSACQEIIHYDGITSFAGLKDQALGAGKESFVGAFKNYVGLPDMRDIYNNASFDFNTPYFPTEKFNITSQFGWRADPFTGLRKFHSGIDVGQSGTSGNVFSVRSGTVLDKGKTRNGTNFISILDLDGYIHEYFHTDSSLSVGEKVKSGSTLGKSDMSGRSTGLHLHYSIKNQNGERIDPKTYLINSKPLLPGGY